MVGKPYISPVCTCSKTREVRIIAVWVPVLPNLQPVGLNR